MSAIVSPVPPASDAPFARLRAGLLVGGSSRRMGRPKALVELAGRAFALRVADALRALAPDLALLGEGPVPVELGDLPRIADAPGVRGPMAAVLAALRASPGSAWLIAACDQPLASVAACRWLIAARRSDRLAVMPRLVEGSGEGRGAGPVEPLLAVYEPSAREPIEALAAGGERSLQAFARRPDVLCPRPPETLVGAWRSLDDPEDLADAEAALEG